MEFVAKFIDKVIELVSDMNSWLNDAVENIAWKYDWSRYQIAWFGFVVGVLLILLLQWIF
tara:strand:+ start:3453 stop:3632 length:180 start_codon:yes stop_codon:yes gene_type:complete